MVNDWDGFKDLNYLLGKLVELICNKQLGLASVSAISPQ
jgi:hypothetical protein